MSRQTCAASSICFRVAFLHLLSRTKDFFSKRFFFKYVSKRERERLTLCLFVFFVVDLLATSEAYQNISFERLSRLLDAPIDEVGKKETSSMHEHTRAGRKEHPASRSTRRSNAPPRNTLSPSLLSHAQEVYVHCTFRYAQQKEVQSADGFMCIWTH